MWYLIISLLVIIIAYCVVVYPYIYNNYDMIQNKIQMANEKLMGINDDKEYAIGKKMVYDVCYGLFSQCQSLIKNNLELVSNIKTFIKNIQHDFIFV